MGNGLFDYAEAHPEQAQAAQEAPGVLETRQHWQNVEKIREIKESISRQIEQGQAPQDILYNAIRAVGLLSNDPEWSERQREALGRVYPEIEQESLFVDREAQAAQRRETKIQDFIDKTRRQLNRQLKSCQSLQKTLEAALNDLAIMDDHDILK